MKKFNILKNIVFLFLALAFAGIISADAQPIKIAAEADLSEQLKNGPCDDKERLEAVRGLFLDLGAEEADIRLEEFKNVENLVVTKKGKTSETVVVGAHYDKIKDGCGTIDNWSGIVILANIYRSVRELETEKTYLFVAFGKEEKGLIGSAAMARAIPKKDRSLYCAMVNFDSFGMAVPQVLTNISDRKLTDLAEDVSKDMGIPFGKAGIDLASSDSASFRQQNIPAVTLHGLGPRWADTIHSSKDKFENIVPNSVYIGYRHGLVMLTRIDEMPCGSFNK